MSDSPATPPIPAADANGQLIVALTIVVVLGILGAGLIAASWVTKNWSTGSVGIGAIVGALSAALNAPTGIGNVLRATTPPPVQPSDPPP